MELGIKNIDTTEEEQKFENVLRALRAYKQVHGNLLVPEDFVVPNSESFDPELAGLKLGKIAKSIRQLGRFSQFREKLVEMGFVYSIGNHSTTGKTGKGQKSVKK